MSADVDMPGKLVLEPEVLHTLNVLSETAQQLKVDTEDFLPFGVVVLESKEVAIFTIKTNEEESETQDYLKQLLDSLREELTGGQYTHAGVCFDMTATDEDGIRHDVFGLYVESSARTNWFFVQPYSLTEQTLDVGDYIPRAAPGLQSLF